jgi:cell division protein FtsI/penicillin-binding protein 2
MNTELRRARHRQMFIFLFVCLAMLGLLVRLYYWQVVRAQDLTQQANAEHIQNQIVNAPRGIIFDATGHILATNVVRDDVYIEPIQFVVDHPDADHSQAQLQDLVQTLHGVLPAVSQDQLMKAFTSGKTTVRIAGPIDPAQSQRLRSLHLPDTFLEPRTLRVYPSGSLAAQTLGYVQDGVGGVYGIEGAYDRLLTGRPGTLTAETDLNGNPLTVGASSGQAAVRGANLTLTIDSTMQQIVQSALADRVKASHAQGGTAVVVDVQTGAIVAMAGEPTFDPNHYGSYYKTMGCLNSENVYFNPALNCAYEPGSTLKSVTMAAALDQGLITPDLSFDDPGYISFKDAITVTNWAYKGYGKETMTGVLEHSANVGAAYVAHDILKADRYYPYLQRFGFGQPTNIGGPEESGTYRTNMSTDWTPSDLTRQAFGQSITATPLQVAMAYAAIANGGVMMRPYLVSAIDNNGQVTQTHPQVLRRVISEKAAHDLNGMLVNAADFNQQATFSGYSVAVKTGTATTQGISDEQTEASMAGFLPASHPRFAILVKVDRPQGGDNIFGGVAAAPLWRYIGQQLMWHYGVAPDKP